jgi:hypothetical protein
MTTSNKQIVSGLAGAYGRWMQRWIANDPYKDLVRKFKMYWSAIKKHEHVAVGLRGLVNIN